MFFFNKAIRANGINYILSELNANNTTATTNGSPLKPNKQSRRLTLDTSFVQEELVSKLHHESSPLVLRQLLAIDVKILLDYVKLEKLLTDDTLLLKLFKNTLDTSLTTTITSVTNDDGSVGEMWANFARENQKWDECREASLDLVFTRLYTASGKEQKDLFFNCFLIVSSRIFELGSVSLLNKLKTTSYYIDLQQETRHAESATVASKMEKISIKSFYSKSSISITKLATGVTHTASVAESNQAEVDACLNEQFDVHLQILTKYMLSNANKLANNSIKAPKCFEAIVNGDGSDGKKITLFYIFKVYISF